MAALQMAVRGTRKKFLVRRAEAQQILGGIAERTFARLEADGVIVPTVRGRGRKPSVYDLALIVPAYLAHVTQRPVSNTISAWDARARRDVSQAELNELRKAERLKELLPRAQIVFEIQNLFRAVQAKLRALPQRMTQAGIPREHEPIAAEIVREALEEMSRWSSSEDLIRANGQEPAE